MLIYKQNDVIIGNPDTFTDGSMLYIDNLLEGCYEFHMFNIILCYKFFLFMFNFRHNIYIADAFIYLFTYLLLFALFVTVIVYLLLLFVLLIFTYLYLLLLFYIELYFV